MKQKWWFALVFLLMVAISLSGCGVSPSASQGIEVRLEVLSGGYCTATLHFTLANYGTQTFHLTGLTMEACSTAGECVSLDFYDPSLGILYPGEVYSEVETVPMPTPIPEYRGSRSWSKVDWQTEGLLPFLRGK